MRTLYYTTENYLPLNMCISGNGGLIAQSCLILCNPWSVAHQAPLSMGFFSQEYSTGLPFPSPGDLPDPGIEPRSPASQGDSLPLSHQGRPKHISPCMLFSLTPGDGEGQGGLVCCGPWGCRELDTTWQLNNKNSFP